MKAPARLILTSAVLIASANTSWGQTIQPTPAPLVTAENETWYRSGEPVAFAGNLYYPAGAAIHFLSNEMVRSGFYQGVPIYSRTTIEPFSMIFVPVGGGLMQPYERRRDGELAGTKGSTPPVISPALAPSVSPTTAASPAMAQAPAPPVVMAPVLADEPMPRVVAPAPPAPAAAPQPVGTAGRAKHAPRPALRARPGAANAAYVEFDNARWFSAGPPVSVDVRSLTLVGQTHGFPVYAARRGNGTIYIPIAQGVDTFGVYSRKKNP